MDCRGQSTQVGTVLLVVVVVIAVSVVTLTLVNAFGEQHTEVTHADLRVNVTTATVSVTNAGGESVALEQLAVVLVADGGSADVSPGVSGQLRPGETWSYAAPLALAEDEQVEVYVTHAPSGTRLFEGTLVVGAAD